MRLLRLTVLVLLTTIVVFEPVVHSHPLVPGATDVGTLDSPNVCAICAVGADSAVMSPAIVVAPPIVIEHLTLHPTKSSSVEVSVSLASRAPPVA